MKAEILCVGTELLLGDILNTNAQFLSRELAALGVNVYRQNVVGDNAERLRKELSRAFEDCDMVITTGGLGPTYDDLTKETAAKYFGVEMAYNAAALKSIEDYYCKTGRTITDAVRKQAYIPEGADCLQNHNGTAPGVLLNKEGKTLILLPGPPREMQPMFLEYIPHYISKKTNQMIISKTVHIFGMGEAAVEEKLRDFMTTHTNPTLAPYAKDGEVQIRVTCCAETKSDAEDAIQPVLEHICKVIGKNIYGIDVGNLQTALVQKLQEKHLSVATAESLTGGLVSERITAVSGASAVFSCGVCAYSNTVKNRILGVAQKTLDTYTEYSSQTALEMARGIRLLSNADIGIATTGIAGPAGGTEEKPVGLVYVAVDSKKGSHAVKLQLNQGRLNTREYIRFISSSQALYMALQLAEQF